MNLPGIRNGGKKTDLWQAEQQQIGLLCMYTYTTLYHQYTGMKLALWSWMLKLDEDPKVQWLIMNYYAIYQIQLFTLEFYELRWMHHLSENMEHLISVLVFLRMSWERSWTGLALSSIAAFRASKPPHWQEPGEEIPLRSGWWRGGHRLQSAASWRSRFHL